MRAVLYACLPGGSAADVTGAHLALRYHAANAGHDAIVGEFHDTNTDPERPALAKAMDAVHAHGAVLLVTDRSGILRVGNNPAALKDIVRSYAPFGL